MASRSHGPCEQESPGRVMAFGSDALRFGRPSGQIGLLCAWRLPVYQENWYCPCGRAVNMARTIIYVRQSKYGDAGSMLEKGKLPNCCDAVSSLERRLVITLLFCFLLGATLMLPWFWILCPPTLYRMTVLGRVARLCTKEYLIVLGLAEWSG